MRPICANAMLAIFAVGGMAYFRDHPWSHDYGGSASSLSYLSPLLPSLRLPHSRTFGRAPVAVRESRGLGLALLALFLPEMLGLLWVTASVPA